MQTNAYSVGFGGCDKSRAAATGYSFYDAYRKTAVLKGVLTIFLLAAPSAFPAQSTGAFQLTGVTVVGSKRYDAAEIARATGLKVGDNLTPDALKDAASRIASWGIFTQVSYRYTTRGNTMTVEFTVADAARFLPCTFGNFVWYSPQELREGLRSRVPLFDGSTPPDGAMVDLISAALVAMLEARGIHGQVQATPLGPLGGPAQAIQFQVTGVPIPVRKIEFTGAEKVDAALLQDAASPLLNKDYDASYIRDFSRGAVAAVYRQRGYLRAGFGDPVPRLLTEDSTPNAVAVTIPVTEGEQYRLKEIAWAGDSAIPYTELAKSLHVAVGDPLNAVQLEQDVLGLLLLFHPKGYLMAGVTPKTVLDDASRSAVYQIQIRQGDLFRLGKLEIAGLDDARASSFQQLSRLRPGDPYDATYWGTYLQEVGRNLPKIAPGWIVGNPVQTIHADTKMVDVRFTFHPTGSK
jgi:outer membrane protein insertion porin family